jgi:hypothetical protein
MASPEEQFRQFMQRGEQALATDWLSQDSLEASQENLQKLGNALIKADALAKQGNEQAAQDAKVLVGEIRRLQADAVKSGPVGQFNRGVAALGKIVDAINPIAEKEFMGVGPTGSAEQGLVSLMEAGGINVADRPPQTFLESMGRYGGEATGYALPAGGVIRGGQVATTPLSLAPSARSTTGKVMQALDQATATTPGFTGQVVGGGAFGGGVEAGKRMGLEETGQTMTGLAAGFVPGAAQAGKRAIEGGAALLREVAPFTEKGAEQVARQTMGKLAGSEERGFEMARQLREEQSPLGLTPAQQIEDPYFLALEREAMARNPELGRRLEARRQQSAETAREETIPSGDVGATQVFFENRRREVARTLQEYIGRAQTRAAEAVPSPKATEAEASTAVANEIRTAFNTAKAEESALWSEVPKNIIVEPNQSVAAGINIIESTQWPAKSSIPKLLNQLIGRYEAGAPENVESLHSLYSELRNTARNAMAGDQKFPKLAANANKMADAILDDLGAFSADNPVGQAINRARAYSYEMHQVFDQGTVGSLLKRSVAGGEMIAPELTLERAIAPGGVKAQVGEEEIRAAVKRPVAPTGGLERIQGSIEDYLRNRFNLAAFSGDQFSATMARNFMNKNKDLMKNYPELRSELESAIAAEQRAGIVQKTGEQMIEAIGSNASAAARIANSSPDKAVNQILMDPRPELAAREVMRQARKDTTGKAVNGLKRAFADYLWANNTGTRMFDVLNEEGFKKVASKIFDPAEMNRWKVLTAELKKLDMKPAQGVEPMKAREANALVMFASRVAAARHGANLGGGMASLQTAQMASSRIQKILNRLTNNKAEELLIRAIEDKELFAKLIRPIIPGGEAEKQVIRAISPYIIASEQELAGEE